MYTLKKFDFFVFSRFVKLECFGAMLSFKAFNKDLEISAAVKSVKDVKELFRAYNIEIEEQEATDDRQNVIEPIVEVTYDESEGDDESTGSCNLLVVVSLKKI